MMMSDAAASARFEAATVPPISLVKTCARHGPAHAADAYKTYGGFGAHFLTAFLVVGFLTTAFLAVAFFVVGFFAADFFAALAAALV